MKKFLTALLAMALAVTCFTACGGGDDEAPAEASGYNGILTKVKLGMPLKKIISLQPDGVNLNYETDTVIWSQNPDTELMEIRDLIPAESAYYYVDDSLITYTFETRKGDTDNIYLTSYMSEAYCLLDRKIAKEYYDKKTDELAKKHGVEAIKSVKGTEDIDLEIDNISRYSCASYDLTFIMREKYDTVDGVDGYYGSYFCIEVKEKANKEEVPADGGSAAE